MFKRLSIVVLCSAFVLTGCNETTLGGVGASLTSSGPKSAAFSTKKTKEEIRLEKEVASLNKVTRQIVVNNTVQGAVFGALAGCILADVMGGKCADGAIAGGVAGGEGEGMGTFEEDAEFGGRPNIGYWILGIR